MERLLLATLFLTGCVGDPELEVVSPADGAIISNNDPIVFVLRGDNIEHADDVEVTVDGVLDDSFTGGVGASTGCYDCTIMQTWPSPAVTNGRHEIKFALTYDLSTVASADVTLLFERP